MPKLLVRGYLQRCLSQPRRVRISWCNMFRICTRYTSSCPPYLFDVQGPVVEQQPAEWHNSNHHRHFDRTDVRGKRSHTHTRTQSHTQSHTRIVLFVVPATCLFRTCVLLHGCVRYLYLYDNQLSSTIPSTIGSLIQLVYVSHGCPSWR